MKRDEIQGIKKIIKQRTGNVRFNKPIRMFLCKRYLFHQPYEFFTRKKETFTLIKIKNFGAGT